MARATLTIASTVRDTNFILESVRVSERINQNPNTASIEVFGFTPSVDEEIIIGESVITERLFRGKITKVEVSRFKLDQGRIVYQLQCVDWTFDINAALVTARFTSTAADSIVGTLITDYGPAGFTTSIQASLATIDEIQFTQVPLGDALTRIANRIGAYWLVTYDKVIHFFTTSNPATAPDTINTSNNYFFNFQHGTDIDQLYNRINVEGMGTTVLDVVAVGQTTMAVADASMFNASGGTIKADHAQLLTYTGRTAGGGDGSTVAHNEAAPGSAPTVAEGATSGALAGSYTYKVTFANTTGETAPSAASSAVTPDAHAAPTSGGAATSDATTWGGLTIGSSNYDWKFSFVTATGETTVGAGFANKSAVSIKPTTAISNSSSTATTGGNMAEGTYYYTYLHRSPSGDSLVSTATAVAFVVTSGKTAMSFAAADMPDPPAGAQCVLCRSVVGGGSGGPFYEVQAIDATAVYVDTAADSELGAKASAVDAAGAAAWDLTSIPTGGTGTIARGVYRTKSGGSTFFLVGVVPDNTTTTFTDAVPDASLGPQAPGTNTAGGETVSLSSIPTGGAAVDSRRIYRTEDGGSTYFFVGEIGDNTTTTYTDNVPDASLGGLAPTESSIAANPADTSIRVLDLENFESGGGWLEAGEQRISYTGRSGSSGEGTLTGIPASGAGAIKAGITAGSSVVPIGFVSGIPSSSTGSVLTQLEPGEAVNIFITRNDASSQSTYGVRERYIQDRRLSQTGCENLGDAHLSLHDLPRTAGSMDSTDPNMSVGKLVTLDIYGLSETRTVQAMELSFGDKVLPVRRASFSSRTSHDFYSELRAIREQAQGQ